MAAKAALGAIRLKFDLILIPKRITIFRPVLPATGCLPREQGQLPVPDVNFAQGLGPHNALAAEKTRSTRRTGYHNLLKIFMLTLD
jgi:hypothetical protein